MAFSGMPLPGSYIPPLVNYFVSLNTTARIVNIKHFSLHHAKKIRVRQGGIGACHRHGQPHKPSAWHNPSQPISASEFLEPPSLTFSGTVTCMNFAIATSPGRGSTMYSSFSKGPPSINSWIRYTCAEHNARKEKLKGLR